MSTSSSGRSMTPCSASARSGDLTRPLQTIRGELTNNLAKLTELDKHIALERQKLDTEGIDEFSRHCIADRLEDLQVERLARLEAAAASKQALHSQINRMRETISRILHEDTTLAERVRTLFREQGVTLLSILHCDRDGYLDPSSGPDWWRIRWKRCDPTATPIGQGRSSRVGQKKRSKLLAVSWPNWLARRLWPCRGSLGALCPGSSALWGRPPDGLPSICGLW